MNRLREIGIIIVICLTAVIWFTSTAGTRPDTALAANSYPPQGKAESKAAALPVDHPSSQKMTPATSSESKQLVANAETEYQFDAEKIAAMRDARLHGDPRTPPITRSDHIPVEPTAEELADPDLYLEYEARNEQQLYANYVQAVAQKVLYLEAFLAHAKEAGVSAEQLEEGYEKIAKLKAMAAQLEKENDLPEHNLSQTDLSRFEIP